MGPVSCALQGGGGGSVGRRGERDSKMMKIWSKG
jgi:hypothetical protein